MASTQAAGGDKRCVHLARYLVHVSSDDAIATESEDAFRFTVPVERGPRNVVAIELAEALVPPLLAPTFIGEVETAYFLRFGTTKPRPVSANTHSNWTLISRDGLQSLSFTCSFDLLRFFNDLRLPVSGSALPLRQLLAYLTYDLMLGWDEAATAQPGAPLSATFYSLELRLDANGRLQVDFVHKDSGARGGVRLSFGSGSDAYRQASRVLGFDAGVDYEATGAVLTAPYPVDVRPFQYVDLRSVDFPEAQPLARIWLAKNESGGRKRHGLRPNRPRFFKYPVARMDRLRLELTLPNGEKPAFGAGTAFDFTFHVWGLVHDDDIPAWLKQAEVI